MSGNPFAKVTKGQRIRVAAAAWNPLMDVARRETGRAGSGGVDAAYFGTNNIIGRIVNSSGTALGRYNILGIDSSMAISPAANLNDFKNVPVLNGVSPTVAAHSGNFVITLEPINKGKIGRCLLSGVCPVVVDQLGGERYADIIAGSTAKLWGSCTGGAEILWSQGAGFGSWAMVRLTPGQQWGKTVCVVPNALLTGNLGWYTGSIYRQYRCDSANPSGTNTMSAFFSNSGSLATVDCYISNLGSLTTGHTVATGQPYLGTITGTATDGKPIVVIDSAPAPVSLLTIQKDGGADATGPTAQATWTYKVFAAGGNVLTTGVTPAFPRPFGKMYYAGELAGSNAFGLFSNAGTLLSATEIPRTRSVTVVTGVNFGAGTTTTDTVLTNT